MNLCRGFQEVYKATEAALLMVHPQSTELVPALCQSCSKVGSLASVDQHGVTPDRSPSEPKCTTEPFLAGFLGTDNF